MVSVQGRLREEYTHGARGRPSGKSAPHSSSELLMTAECVAFGRGGGGLRNVRPSAALAVVSAFDSKLNGDMNFELRQELLNTNEGKPHVGCGSSAQTKLDLLNFQLKMKKLKMLKI